MSPTARFIIPIALVASGLAFGPSIAKAENVDTRYVHLEGIVATLRQAGLPRDQIFTHSAGWKEGELLYRSAVNEHSCPGWSFYRYARNPKTDKTAMAAVAASDAPFWAAAEWLPIGAQTADDWHAAIRNTLAIDRCRYVCIYNWRQLKSNAIAVEGIRRELAEPIAGSPTSAEGSARTPRRTSE